MPSGTGGACVGEDGVLEAFRVLTEGPPWLETGILEAGGDGGALAMAEDDLDLFEAEVRGVETGKFGGRIGWLRWEGGHCLQR